MNTLRQLGLLAAAAAAGAAFADSTWTGAADTNLGNAENWSAGIPTSAHAQFNAPIGSLTLAENLTLGSGSGYVWFNGTGAINLDLGAGNTLTAGSRTFVKPGAVVTLRSGTYHNPNERFFVGDNWSGATMIVDGPNSRLIGSTSQYIEVGSANGADSKDNLLKVQNGGYASGYINMGRLANGDARSECGTNTLWVTGAGSTFAGNNQRSSIGMQQGYSHLIVDDKAKATFQGHLTVGLANTDNNRTYVGKHNLVRVADGATMDVKGWLTVGYHGASNRLEIANGASVTASALFTSYETSGAFRPLANVVRVTGTNSTLTLTAKSGIGNDANSFGDTLEILDGAVMTLNGNIEFNIGETLGSHGHRVLVNGGSLSSVPSSFHLGKYGDCNTLTVTNGGVVSFGPGQNFVHVGYCSASNVLEVAAGGEVRCGTQMRMGWYNRADGSKPGGNKIWIHGKDAKFLNTADFRLDRFDGQIGNQIVIEDGGYFQTTASMEFPYSARDNVTQRQGEFSSNLQVRVTGEGSRLVVTNKANFLVAMNIDNTSTNVDTTVYVAKGGEFLMYGGECYIGYGTSSGNAVCERNGLHVGQGGRFAWMGELSATSYPSFRVGNHVRACNNYVRVEGEFDYTATGSQRSDLFSVGYQGMSNRFEVVNGGRAKISNAGFFVGANTAAIGNRAYVGQGSTLTLTNMEYAAIGQGGAGASLVVDGGTLDMFGTYRLVTGSMMAASNATFVVKNGGVATLTRLVLGDKAPNSTATIDNATLHLVEHGGISGSGYLDIGYSAASASSDPSHATLVVRGRNAKVKVGRNIRMRNPTAQIRFVVPAEGFAETPLECTGGFETVATGASIHVSADPAWPRGSKATLLHTIGTGAIGNLALTCDEGLRIRRVGTKIVASNPGGCVLLVR